MEIHDKLIGGGTYYTAFPWIDKGKSIYVSVEHWNSGQSRNSEPTHRAALIKNDERGRKLAFELLELCAEYLWKNGEKSLNSKKVTTITQLPLLYEKELEELHRFLAEVE